MTSHQYTISDVITYKNTPDFQTRLIRFPELQIEFPLVYLKRAGRNEIEEFRRTIINTLSAVEENSPYLIMGVQSFPGPVGIRSVIKLSKEIYNEYRNLSHIRGTQPIGCAVGIYQNKWQAATIGRSAKKLTDPYVDYKSALSLEEGIDHILDFVSQWDFENGKYLG